MLDCVRDNAFTGADITLNLAYKQLKFKSGGDFLEYVDKKKLDLNTLASTGTIEQ